jgi:hypothetical protein
MIQQSSALSLFSLLLLTTSLGVLSFSPLQTITAAFAQNPPSSSSSLADEIIDETAISVQDSSAADNVLEGSNEFGDEDAAIEQDNTAEQDDANVGAQEQEQESAQDAANTDVDVQEGVQQPPPPTEPPGLPPPPPPPPDDGEPPPLRENGRIVFSATRGDNDWDIYVMNPDGSGETRIIDDPGIDVSPDWSPDGTKISIPDRESRHGWQ